MILSHGDKLWTFFGNLMDYISSPSLILYVQKITKLKVYNLYSGARIIRTKITRKICANYLHVKVNGVYREAYNCAN